MSLPLIHNIGHLHHLGHRSHSIYNFNFNFNQLNRSIKCVPALTYSNFGLYKTQARDLDVAYFRDTKSASPTKVANSLLTLELSGESKVRHDEEWGHQKIPRNEDDFLDMLTEQKIKIVMNR